MDVVGVQDMKIRKHHKINKSCKKGIKVVYISSPMKVKTCASKFRALVQELTGKNSDADAAALRFSNNVNDAPEVHPVDACAVSSGVAAAADDQFHDDHLFMPHCEASFLGMFTSNLLHHHDFIFQQDHALQSFDSL